MAEQRLERLRNYALADSDVTGEVPTGDIMADHFEFGDGYPTPGLLIENVGGLRDDIGQQDMIFMVKCFHNSVYEAEVLWQIVRTSFSGYPEFGTFTASMEAAQQVLWSARGLRKITIETEGQSLAEPLAGGRRGTEFMMGTFRARYPGV